MDREFCNWKGLDECEAFGEASESQILVHALSRHSAHEWVLTKAMEE